MAATTQLQLLVTLKDQASSALKGLSGKMEAATSASKNFALGLAGAAVGLGLAAKKAIDYYQQQENADKRLAQIATQVTGATKEQIQGYKDLAQQMQNTGVMGNDVIEAGQSQIASFTHSAAVVTKLSGSLADLAVAQYGANVNQDQAIQTANLLGKALSGQLGALTRAGILVSDDYAAAFKKANTEQERASILAKIVADNYGGLNKAMRDTSAGGLAALKNNFGDLMKVIGKELVPMLNKLVAGLNGFIQNTMPKIIDKTKQMIEWFKKNKAAIYIVAGAILGGLVLALRALAVALIENLVLLAPFMIGGAIIGAIVAGIVWLVKNWTMLRDKALSIFREIADFLKSVWNGITNALKSVWNGIKDFFGLIWNGIKTVFKTMAELVVGLVIAIFNAFGIDIVGVFKKITLYLRNAWEQIKNVFTLAGQFIAQLWSTLWQGMSIILGPIWSTISGALVAAWDYIKTIFTKAAKPVSEAWSNLWTALGNVFKQAWATVENTIKSSINWILGKINNVINAINSVAAKGAGALHMTAIQIPTIPLLANGGIVTKPTLAVVGEAGPEAVIPLSRGGGAGYGNITVNITGNTISNKLDIKNLADAVSESIMKTLRLNSRLA